MEREALFAFHLIKKLNAQAESCRIQLLCQKVPLESIVIIMIFFIGVVEYTPAILFWPHHFWQKKSWGESLGRSYTLYMSVM